MVSENTPMTMKRALLAGIIVMTAAVSGFGLDLGLDIGYALSLRGQEASGGTTMNNSATLNLLRGSLFFDLEYFRVSAVGFLSVGDMYSSGQQSSPARVLTVGGDVLAKLPVVIGSVRLWSGLGARFMYHLLLDFDGDGDDDRAANDRGFTVFALAAVGGTWQTGKVVSFGGSFGLSYDVLERIKSTADSAATNVVFEFSAFIGFTI